jgi:hypothetical protein
MITTTMVLLGFLSRGPSPPTLLSIENHSS